MEGQPGRLAAGWYLWNAGVWMMRVLVAEDHVKLAEAVASGLRREGMAVDVVLDGRQALDRASVTAYDVIVLDRDLPEVHGDEVCRHLVAEGRDDYLPKPFAFAELVARIRALSRRSRPPLPPLLVKGDLRLDPAHRVVTRAGRRLGLTVKEFAVLQLLLEAQGAVVPAEELLEKAWDEMADPFTTTVKATIHRLRAKLGDPPVIHTIPQAGYRI